MNDKTLDQVPWTAGKWLTSDAFGPAENGTCVSQENGSMICSTTGYFGRDGAIANARLIAEAPVMAALLEEVRDDLCSLPASAYIKGQIAKIDALLSRLKGTKP